MLDRLESVRAGEWYADKRNEFNHALRDRRYGEMFREANLDVDALPADEAGERIRSTTVAVELAAALDEWSYARIQSGASGDRRKHLLRVARAADRDGWRTRLRVAVENEDREALLDLASQDEAAQQLPSTLLALANLLWVPRTPEKAVPLLRAAWQKHPDDYWINYNLAEYSRSSHSPLRRRSDFLQPSGRGPPPAEFMGPR